MEAERRSTMSSLKGQLSNVEGSVKSMKAAVVVGSVLTVACLAAVFGVTIAANEVSKEVKVNNSVLATKSGKAVLTSSTLIVNQMTFGAKTVTMKADDATITMAVNAQVQEGKKLTTICDDYVIVAEAGEIKDVTVVAGSPLAAVAETEKRSASFRLRAIGKFIGAIGIDIGLDGTVAGMILTCAEDLNLAMMIGVGAMQLIGSDCDMIGAAVKMAGR